MASIAFNNVSFHYDTPFVSVFDNLSLSIDTTWNTAIVGRNGRGKTTLLRLIQRDIQPVRGEVVVPLETHYFPYQPPESSGRTLDVIRECIAPFSRWESRMRLLLGRGDESSLREYGELLQRFETNGGYEIEARIEKELADLGMPSATLRQQFDTLSGGERTRALVIALFLREGGFPLIDEPTNHLDLKGRMLLGEYLARKEGFLLVSHDRHFLDLCADHVVSIGRDRVRTNHCGFSDWRAQVQLEQENERRRQEKLKREIRSLEDAARQRRGWAQAKEKQKIGAKLEKGFISHRAAKQMKRALSIERRLAEMITEKKGLMKSLDKERRLKLKPEENAPEVLLAIGEATIKIAARTVIQNLSLTVHRGDRIAVVGPNGSGKTTLLRAIAGELDLTSGAIRLPRHLHVARAHQTPVWQQGLLRDHLRRGGIDETQFRNVMGSFGVSGEIFDRPLETFSQGERKKVDLCRSFTDPAHLLLWDEPLNYVDLMSREQIENVILEYQPTMLFVEHDGWFIDRVATGIVELPGR